MTGVIINNVSNKIPNITYFQNDLRCGILLACSAILKFHDDMGCEGIG